MSTQLVNSIFPTSVTQHPEISDTQDKKKLVLNNPDWGYWRLKKYVRPWQAILLSLNIQPAKGIINKIKTQDTELYKEYRKRRSILLSNMGQKIEYSETHILAGEKAKEKYIDIINFYGFAEKLNWQHISKMRQGLNISLTKNNNQMTAKQENNILRFLDDVLRIAIESDKEYKYERRLPLIKEWFKKHNANINPTENTLRSWIKKIEELRESEQ